MKKDCGLLIFGTRKNMNEWIPLFSKYFEFKNILIWDKMNHSAGDLKGNFGDQYEVILFFTRGDFQLRGYRHSNIFSYPRISYSKLNHPSEKPIALIKELLISVKPDNVLDLFSGSGVVPRACESLKIPYIAYEIDMKYKTIINENIKLGKEESKNKYKKLI